MKNLALIIPVAAMLVLGGCSGCKKGCMDPTAANYDLDARRNCCCQYPDPVLTLSFDHRLRGQPFEFGKITTTDDSIPFNFDVAQFFISNIKLLQGSGSYWFTDDSCTDNHFLMISPASGSYEVGGFPPGDYTGITFTLGVDTGINNTMFPAEACISSSAGHPLNNPDMHWGMPLGYLFIKLEGGVDTSVVQDGILDVPLVMHIGTNSLVRTVNIPYTFTAAKKASITLELKIEWKDMLDGIDLRADCFTQTTDDPALATAVADNGPQMITKK